MRKTKLATSMVLSTALLLSPAIAGAAADKAPVTPKSDAIGSVNLDGNKIFDNLEAKMADMASQDKVDVIVQFNDSFNGKAADALQKKIGDFTMKYEYTHALKGVAGTLTKGQINALENVPFVKSVELDVEVQTTMNQADYWFGNESARNQFSTVDGDRDGDPNSYSKDDVTIAVIDTGIDVGHNELDGGKVIGWHDIVNGNSSPYDDQGHGTHCAGIAAGDGIGVAPGAALVGVKVLDQNGSGSMSDVAAGINWAVQNKNTYGIDIISLSLGSSGSGNGTTASSVAVNNAVANGIAVTVAAGNAGSDTYTIGEPGAAVDAITVGAGAEPGEEGFFLAQFSSRGPTADERIGMDIVGGGVEINSAEAGTTNGYVSWNGTSMATPNVAGTIALMLDANPSLSVSQVKNHLYNTARDAGAIGRDIDYGYGYLDGFSAIESAGGFNGTNIDLPNLDNHNDTVANGGSKFYSVNVTDTSIPIAATMITQNYTSSFFGASPDLDLYIFDPSGTELDKGYTTNRQEEAHSMPTTTGTYTVEVRSYSGGGDFFLDISYE